MLPEEIINKILLRLPVASLVRCTGVCKQWQSMIKSPHFIFNHLSSSSSDTDLNQDHLLVGHRTAGIGRIFFTLHTNPGNLSDYRLISCPAESSIVDIIVGSVHGLICFQNSDRAFLWNAAISRYFQLPPHPPHYNLTFGRGVEMGLGFDPAKSDYIVVRVLFHSKIQRRGELGTPPPAVPPIVAVYSLNQRSWRSLSAAAAVGLDGVYFMWSPLFMNGNLHWLALEETVDFGDGNLIVLFDVVDERLTRMELPSQLLTDLDLVISEMNGLLAIFDESGIGRSVVVDFYTVWVMKEYGVATSWIQIYRIGCQDLGLHSILGFYGCGNGVLATKTVQVDGGIRGDFTKLVMYDLENNEFEDLVVDDSLYAYYKGTYVESLVLLDMAHQHEDA